MTWLGGMLLESTRTGYGVGLVQGTEQVTPRGLTVVLVVLNSFYRLDLLLKVPESWLYIYESFGLLKQVTDGPTSVTTPYPAYMASGYSLHTYKQSGPYI